MPLAGTRRRRIVRIDIREPERDTSLLQIVGGHFHFHLVTGENAYAMDAHATGQVAKELVIFRFGTRDSDAERGVWEGFFDNADELDDILGHRV